MVRLDDIIQNGDMNDYLTYIERAKRQGLDDEVAEVEQEMLQRRSELSRWLRNEVQVWGSQRCTLEEKIEDAKRVGLEDIVAGAEAALATREKLVTESIQVSVDKGLRFEFEQWVKHAHRLGMEELVAESHVFFKEKAQVVKLALLEAATCGTNEEFLRASEKARSMGMESEVQRSVSIFHNRVSDLMSVAAEVAAEALSTTGEHQTLKWEALRARARLLGVTEDVLEHVRDTVYESKGAPPPGEFPRRESEETVSFSSSRLEDERGSHIPVWSMMQNWKEMQQLRRTWQMKMIQDKQAQKSSSGFPGDGSLSIQPKADVVASPRDQADYESDGEEKHDLVRSEREMEAILSIPLFLTRSTIEQRMNCSKPEALKALTRLDLNHEGLSSLGDGVISEWCPNTRVLTCDMNRLTTLKFAFIGCEESVEHVSAKNNFITDVLELETLFNLETLRLDGNNISSVGPVSTGALKNATMKQINCWPSLRELTIGCNRITRVNELGMLCPGLQVLDLGSNHLVTMGGTRGTAFAGLRHLRVLDVGQNRLKGRSLWESLKHCPMLISLVASRNRLTELPTFFGSVLLRELWLNGNAIRKLSCSAWMPNLQRLYLQDNSIETLEPLWGCPVLEVLDLSFNSISDLSQLRHLACFLHLRSLQLNDNPVSERGDYVDTVLEAVPWLLELDNEAVTESSKNRTVKRIFLKVMARVGMQYLHEKAGRGEIVISECTGKPDEVQRIIIGCRKHQKLEWFHNLHSDSVFSAGGQCEESSCSGKHIVPLKVLQSGAASRAILWSALFEAATLYDSTRSALQTLLSAGEKHLVLSDDAEAKQDVFESMGLCFKQREKLLLASKNDREAHESDEDSRANSRRCIDELEFSLRQHVELPRLCSALEKRHATRIQALVRGFLSKRSYQRQGKAARRIQARWRSWELEKLRLDLERKFAPLIRLQALWRGFSVRRKLKSVLASSKYVDEDAFHYDEIDDREFFEDLSSTLESCTPDIILSTGSNSRSSECPSDMPRAAQFLNQRTSGKESPSPSQMTPVPMNPEVQKSEHSQETVEQKSLQMAQIAEEWGFKDEKTVKQFLKACKKVKKPTRVSKPVVQDPQKRLEIFKARVTTEAPIENQMKQQEQQVEKMVMSNVNKRPAGGSTPEHGKTTPTLEKDVLKPSVYLFGIPTH